MPDPMEPTGPYDPTDNNVAGKLQVPPAKITIGSFVQDDGDALFADDGQPVTIFTDYLITNRIENDKHVYMGGVSSPGGFAGNSVAFVQLTNPTTLWISEFTAERYASPPPLPSTDPQNSNWVLMDVHYDNMDVKYGPDGVTPLYRVSGTYVYGARNPNQDPILDLYFGLSPQFLDSNSTAPGSLIRKMGTGDLEEGLTGPTPGRP